jgi:hypothetical protein
MLRSHLLLVPLATAGAVLAAAWGAAGPGSSSNASASVAARSGDGPSVITVRGTKCPKSHPHKVGSSSAASWTQVDGGPVVHHARRSSICAR